MAKKKVEVPVWFQESFPDWKKNLIGGLRTFVTGFISSVSICLITATPDVLVTQDFWVNAVLIGGLSGGLVYLGKWLRDKFFESKLVQKLPF